MSIFFQIFSFFSLCNCYYRVDDWYDRIYEAAVWNVWFITIYAPGRLFFSNRSLIRPVELFNFFEGEDNFITLSVVLEFTWLLTGVEGAWSWVKHGKVVESWQIYMWFVRQDVVYKVFHLDDYVLIWVLVAQPGCHTYVWFAASHGLLVQADAVVVFVSCPLYLASNRWYNSRIILYLDSDPYIILPDKK